MTLKTELREDRLERSPLGNASILAERSTTELPPLLPFYTKPGYHLHGVRVLKQ